MLLKASVRTAVTAERVVSGRCLREGCVYMKSLLQQCSKHVTAVVARFLSLGLAIHCCTTHWWYYHVIDATLYGNVSTTSIMS